VQVAWQKLIGHGIICFCHICARQRTELLLYLFSNEPLPVLALEYVGMFMLYFVQHYIMCVPFGSCENVYVYYLFDQSLSVPTSLPTSHTYTIHIQLGKFQIKCLRLLILGIGIFNIFPVKFVPAWKMVYNVWCDTVLYFFMWHF
jgi:hypothetical protein